MKMYETRNDAPTPGYQEQSQQKPAVDENNVAEENHEDPAPGTGGHHKNPLARQHVPALTPTLLGSLRQLSILDLIIQTKTEAEAERSWIAYRWPHGVRCPRPGCSSDWIRERRGYKRPNALPVTFFCRGCGQPFTVRTYYVMKNSSLGFRDLALGHLSRGSRSCTRSRRVPGIPGPKTRGNSRDCGQDPPEN